MVCREAKLKFRSCNLSYSRAIALKTPRMKHRRALIFSHGLTLPGTLWISRESAPLMQINVLRRGFPSSVLALNFIP